MIVDTSAHGQLQNIAGKKLAQFRSIEVLIRTVRSIDTVGCQVDIRGTSATHYPENTGRSIIGLCQHVDVFFDVTFCIVHLTESRALKQRQCAIKKAADCL